MVYVIPGNPTGIWALDVNTDASAQTPTLVVDIVGQGELRSPFYWSPDCSAFLANGYRSADTNDGSTNVVHVDAATGALTRVSQHGSNGKTLAQDANYAACSGSGCSTSKNGGLSGQMGFLADGSVWFESNRDVWKDSMGMVMGTATVLRWDPANPTAFDQLTTYTGAKPWAVSKDGSRYAVANGSTVQIFDASDAVVATSDFDFNAANLPGYMRFVP